MGRVKYDVQADRIDSSETPKAEIGQFQQTCLKETLTYTAFPSGSPNTTKNRR